MHAFSLITGAYDCLKDNILSGTENIGKRRKGNKVENIKKITLLVLDAWYIFTPKNEKDSSRNYNA